MLQVKLLHPQAKPPTRGSDGSAGYDLYALEGGSIEPHSKCIVRTGISVVFPKIQIPHLNLYGSIRSRSGLSAKSDLEVGAGVIDSDYTGEIKVILRNHGSRPFVYEKGDRIAQLVLEVYYHADVELVNELSTTDRQDAGFGSTGLK